jgi:hypothetical protein
MMQSPDLRKGALLGETPSRAPFQDTIGGGTRTKQISLTRTHVELGSIDLSTGAATSLGQIGTDAGFNLTGLAAPIAPTAVP